ncbi:methionyl-tRNA formyltransferase [Abditibacteriota bacterium]|nr:methionyl-tRNA formyltransferase [Abditibacteriota bacterium]
MKIAFMGTPALAVPCLETLSLDHEIKVVITQPDKLGGRGGKDIISSPVKKWALERYIAVLQPERARNESFVEELRAFEVEAIAVVAYGQILPNSILEMASKGCVNLHFSLLPRWRGAAPVQYALWHGDKVTGVTTQWMAAKLDAGDIIQQLEVEVLPTETSGELLNRLTNIGAGVLRETFAMLASGTAPRVPQDESNVTFCPQIQREDAQIDWSKGAVQANNTIRAMNPWPVAWCDYSGSPLKIFRAGVEPTHGKAGQIMAVERDSVIIGAGEDSLRLLEVQAPGKAKMSAGDWARGARLNTGEML